MWPALLLALPLLAGCTSLRTTEPARTATEQFLMTQAASQAIEQISAVALRDRLVYVDSSYLAVADREFFLAELRARLLTSGVRLVNQREGAKIILEVRSAGIGIDRYEYLVGIPAIGVINTPEFAIVKKLRQRGFASVAFVAYWADSGELVTTSGPFVGRAFRQDYWLFGTGPRTIGTVPTAEASP